MELLFMRQLSVGKRFCSDEQHLLGQLVSQANA